MARRGHPRRGWRFEEQIVDIGTDTYGKVKRVGATPIVTKFAMVSGLPLLPLASYYHVGDAPKTRGGAPFVLGIEIANVVGLRLARVDRLSVAMAYFRALMAVLVLFGSMAVVLGVTLAMGQRVDDVGMMMGLVLGVFLLVGVTGGLLSYCLPFQVSRRERAIREACGELLGIAADPARVTYEVAEEIGARFGGVERPGALAGNRSRGQPASMRDLAADLIRVRAAIALGSPADVLEARTDQLLEELRRVSGHG
jgi:hypothetical protein